MDEHKQHNLDKRKPQEVNDSFVSVPNTVRTDKDLIVKDRFNVNNVESQLLHGQKVKLRTIKSGEADTTNLLLTDYVLAIGDVNISRTITLPNPPLAGFGKVYVVKDISGSASATTITISPFASETIDGDTGDSINADFDVRRYFTDGTNWFTY